MTCSSWYQIDPGVNKLRHAFAKQVRSRANTLVFHDLCGAAFPTQQFAAAINIAEKRTTNKKKRIQNDKIERGTKNYVTLVETRPLAFVHLTDHYRKSNFHNRISLVSGQWLTRPSTELLEHKCDITSPFAVIRHQITVNATCGCQDNDEPAFSTHHNMNYLQRYWFHASSPRQLQRLEACTTANVSSSRWWVEYDNDHNNNVIVTDNVRFHDGNHLGESTYRDSS